MSASGGYRHGGNVFAVSRALGIAPEEILDFSASINPLGPSPAALQAISECIPRLVHYPEENAASLREALAVRHGVDPSLVVTANGSTQLIHLVPRLFPGRRALIVGPAFSEYARGLDRAGWERGMHLLRPEDDFALDLRRLRDDLHGRCDLLYICNPGNPTGRAYPPAQMEEILAFCGEAGILAVVDEAFVDFCEENSIVPQAVAEGAVVLRSMTKFHGIPGLRLGYAVAGEEQAAVLTAGIEPWSVNSLAQAAGVASLSDAGHAERTLRHVAAEREFLFRELERIPSLTPFPSSANYLLMRLTPPLDAPSLCARLLESERILVRDCTDFDGLGPSFVRIAVRTEEENRRLVHALQRIC